MRAMTVSLIAVGGAYLLAAAFWRLMSSLREEHRQTRSLAHFCGALTAYAWSSALTWEATTPAEAAPPQLLQLFAFVAVLVFFTEHVLRIAGESADVWILQRRIGIFAVMLAAAGLFYDPAAPDRGLGGRPISELTAVGLLCMLPMAAVATYAFARLFARARRRRDLLLPTLFGLVAVAASLVDLLNRALEIQTDVQLGPHGAVFALVGFMYVELGETTRIDVELAEQTLALERSRDLMRNTQAELLRAEQLAAVGELSAVIAHEVRNPLAIIKNAVSGLRRDTLKPDDAETLLEILDEETDRLDHLVDDLLAYAKPISPDLEPVDIGKVVAHAVELAAGGDPEIGRIEVELGLDDPMPSVQGDQALLRHALINIVDNALQAMPEGGTLTVSLREAVVDGRAGVSVDFHDTGEGMDTQVRSRAVDPFFTTRQSGTGLGLAIVERVARAHGGRVKLDSRHGKGTTVSFFVPTERSSKAPTAV